MQIKINNKTINCSEGESVLEIARKNGIDIPALCYHKDLEIKANCRLCLIEVKGKNGLLTSCSTKVEPNMEIKTNSLKIEKARVTNLELIFGQHELKCNRKAQFKSYRFGPSIEFDSSKCIDCRNCIDVCQKQQVGFYELKKIDNIQRVVPTSDKNISCIDCGQCITHCPVGAIEAVGEFETSENPFLLKNKIIVVQIAPSIRASIGEEFGLPAGSLVTEQLVAAIRRLGAHKVFDVSLGADFTTIEEANELIERIQQNKILPLFTACCPAWVKFIKFYYPEFIPNLTTVRSPQIISGGLTKTYWADLAKVNPKDIFVVSIMPCTAKKHEALKPELKVNGLMPVDQVLTTRELAYLIKKKKINLAKIKGESTDNPLGVYSGAGVIYGASGGVMESALRSAYQKLCGKNLSRIDFTEVRGLAGIKKATIKINEYTLKVAITNGMTEAKSILDELKENPMAYDYVEFMACTGGCIGGGGQPVPVDSDTRLARAKVLYDDDRSKKIRIAGDNPMIAKIYKTFFKDKKNIHQVCHTKHN
ncbi:MAG: [FeFe] hydrogenase, group A [Candidatus Falkowbacteria bacterium]|nr:[FeFe] hydrogenase, group A [Candidatus Falkowbacteria bacterium]